METMEIDRKSPSSGEEPQKSKPVVVMLMGLPGSGKSTFCDNVMQASSRPWVRICQDIINNGKAGTKIQCLSSAASALKDGKSVFIDRCNINREQRAEFLNLGGKEVEKHAVVLDLPARLCISRSVKRTGHEGNLQGGKAAIAVNQMVSKKELPKLTEGFTRITIFQDEKDVKEAIDLYRSLGPLDSLPSGWFGHKSADTKTQQGIMKFLKKVDPPRNKGSEPTPCLKLIPSESSPAKDSDLQGTKKYSDQSNVVRMLEEADKLDVTSTFGIIAANHIPTLAFPSISTADFKFNLEKASDIIVEKVEKFVSKIGNARLVLVDISSGSKILSLVKSKAERKKIDSSKFFTFVGDITQLQSLRGLHCNVIANAANWRLTPRGGGVNAAIFTAAGSALEIATKERADHLRPGQAVVVPLPSSSPLFTKEGVTHVIHVLGPNMNPERPDCLKNDYEQGCKLLCQAYSSLFEGFLSILRGDLTVSSHNSERSLESGHLPTVDYQNLKREAVNESDRNKKPKGSQLDVKFGVGSSTEGNNIQDKEVGAEMTKTWPPGCRALYNIAMDPNKHEKDVLEILDDVVVMNDAFPKAQRHILVIVRANGLDSIEDIRGEHIALLKTMHAAGLKWAEKLIAENKSLLFRLGYHSTPSMRQLHLHVISQDFDSDLLKNKKHWNSFNTPFFLDSVDVIKELEETGTITLRNDESFTSMELRCHRCRSVHPNIPRLKSHIRSCQASFPTALLQNGRLVSAKDV